MIVLLSVGCVLSVVFLAYAIYNYLSHENSPKQEALNADVAPSKSNHHVTPTIVTDPQTGSVMLTLSNGLQVNLSPLDAERHKRGVTALELNNEYLSRNG